MPADDAGRAKVLQWALAALNSIESDVTRWASAHHFEKDKAAATVAEKGMLARFASLERVLSGRDFLVGGRFTAADILMADVLRGPKNDGKLDGFPALTDNVTRMAARPAFQKAHAAQLTHFAAA